MHVETARELRARAQHARQLADQMSNREAQIELNQIADVLDREAEGIEAKDGISKAPPPSRAV